jgi:hypothetical protein
MNPKGQILGLVALAAIASACAADPLENTSLVGLQKQEIIARYGEPLEVERMVRQSAQSHIFGPPEGIWESMQPGDAMVIWTLKARTGKKFLYFLNDENTARLDSFWYYDESKNPVY